MKTNEHRYKENHVTSVKYNNAHSVNIHKPLETFKNITELEAYNWKKLADEEQLQKTVPTLEDQGGLQPIAGKSLMKIIWAGRAARHDLLRALRNKVDQYPR